MLKHFSNKKEDFYLLSLKNLEKKKPKKKKGDFYDFSWEDHMPIINIIFSEISAKELKKLKNQNLLTEDFLKEKLEHQLKIKSILEVQQKPSDTENKKSNTKKSRQIKLGI
jgi:hypothetical protein